MVRKFLTELLEQHDLFRWGILPGRYFYIADYFETLAFHFPHYSSLSWPRLVVLFVGDEMQVVGSKRAIDQRGLELFREKILPISSRVEIFSQCDLGSDSLTAFFEKLELIDLKGLSHADFMCLVDEFDVVVRNFWLPTMVVELANYGGFSFFESEYLKRGYCTQALLELLMFSRATFFQREEEELFATSDLSRHKQKYFWLANDYCRTTVLSEANFAERKAALLKCSRDFSHGVDLSLPPDPVVAALRESLWKQQERKQYILQLQHYKTLFLSEASRRLGVSQRSLYHYSLRDIRGLLEGVAFEKRLGNIGVDCDANKFALLPSAQVDVCWDVLSDRSSSSAKSLSMTVLIAGKRSEIVGSVFCPDYTNLTSVPSGSIVVMRSVSSEQFVLLKRAQAIVVENCASITHAVFMQYAYHYHALEDRPALVVVPGICQKMKTNDRVVLYLHESRMTVFDDVRVFGTIASKGPDLSIKGRVVTETSPPSTEEAILVVNHLSLEMLFRYRHVRCIVSASGGLTSHVSIICRELGIPYICAVEDIQTVYSWKSIEVDFNDGSIRECF